MRQTLVEKILARHSREEITGPGQIVQCEVSLVLANDITAPLAIKSFRAMQAGNVFDRERIVLVCDHFTPNKDIESAEQVKVVREFAHEQGLKHFYEGGRAGVEHALLPELGLVGTGDIVIGADSHTCTYGGVGAFATGLGSTDVAGAMALGATWFKVPPTLRVDYSGTLRPFVGGKDLILSCLGKIGVSGALYQVLEFGGEVVDRMDVEARMTMANMVIEGGAKAGLFAADEKTLEYCTAVGRSKDSLLAADVDAGYLRRFSIDVTDMEPQIACPHRPDNVRPVSEIKDIRLDQVVLGSCTNGRISDLREAARVIKGHKVAPHVRFIVLPATPAIYRQALREGLLEIFMESGAIVGPPTCGPCLGGHMGILAGGEVCLATTNRNFKGRMGSLDSFVYLGSPAVAAASAVAGVIINPLEIV